MKIALLQIDLVWEDKVANLQKIAAMLDTITTTVDLIVLPEMFTTGFSMQPTLFAEQMPTSPTVAMMQTWATRFDAAVCGSIIVVEKEQYYNRFIWVQPDGTVLHYDKRHLFAYAHENEHYTAGKDKCIITWRNIRICPMICYDLRFPVWSRNTEMYDILLYVANFPARRSHAWKSLLVARAIENQCFTIGLNRVGYDGNGIYHSGDSAFIDYEGNILTSVADEEQVILATISLAAQNDFRQKFPFLNDKDDFRIVI